MGQNYASQSQNPAAVIHWYKYFCLYKIYFLDICFKLFPPFARMFWFLIYSHFHCYCRTPVTATPSTPSTRTSRSAPRCSTSAGGGAADGRLCGSAKTVTPLKVEMTHVTWSLLWKVTRKGKCFKGYRIYDICFILGCPVRRQSCNTTSSDLEVNNVLSKETAYTYSMCSGKNYLSGGMQHISKYHYILPCFLELCQEMSTNGSSPCKAWTFYPPQLCILSDSCSNNEDQAATSGDVDCPPGMEARNIEFINNQNYLWHLFWSN